MPGGLGPFRGHGSALARGSTITQEGGGGIGKAEVLLDLPGGRETIAGTGPSREMISPAVVMGATTVTDAIARARQIAKRAEESLRVKDLQVSNYREQVRSEIEVALRALLKATGNINQW